MRGRIFIFALLLLVAGCSSTQPVTKVFRADKLAAMDAAINSAIASNQCPGGVLWLERNGTAYHKAFGSRALVPAREKMTEDTIFDAASLTKVIAATPAVMLIVERGQIRLDAAVTNYIPEFTGDGREAVTVRELLTHTSGLPPDIETKSDWHGQAEAVKKACAVKLQSTPGTVFKYSDINFFLLGEIVQRVSKTPLEVFVQREIYAPLKMTDTGYLPPQDKLFRIAPTEVVDGKPWRGVVHDPTARHMGGVAGHAGLFATAPDLARYARMLMNLGELDGARILKPETVKLMTSVQTPPEIRSRRGLGWDIDSPFSGPRGELFPIGSYGHTGWTGGSLWIDPFSKTFVIFLSNRNHPTEAGSVISLRHKLGTLAAGAVENFDFTNVPDGLDRSGNISKQAAIPSSQTFSTPLK
jgi:CubicO group peptidase (beta-lactamase class C family)